MTGLDALLGWWPAYRAWRGGRWWVKVRRNASLADALVSMREMLK